MLRWGHDERGLVVVVTGEQTALPGYVTVDRVYLLHGCMIEVAAFGLIHYDDEALAQDEGLVFLARAT